MKPPPRQLDALSGHMTCAAGEAVTNAVYTFNRFRNGQLLAEAAETAASSEDGARENVRRRYAQYASCRYDDYVLFSVRDWSARAEVAFEAWLARRRPHVAARIRRFNPKPPPEGEWMRGYCPTQMTHGLSVYYGWLARGAFIRTYGRAAWAAMPTGSIRKRGRRAYVKREAALNCVWEQAITSKPNPPPIPDDMIARATHGGGPDA